MSWDCSGSCFFLMLFVFAFAWWRPTCIDYMNNMAGVLYEVGTTYHSRASVFTFSVWSNQCCSFGGICIHPQCLVERGAQLVSIRQPTVCRTTRHSNIANILLIKNSSMLMISVSENCFVESEWVMFLLQNKICPFLYIALRWLFLFMKDSWTNSFSLSFSIEWGIVV